MVRLLLQPVVIVIAVCHAIATDGGVGGVFDHGLCLDRSVALTFEGSDSATFHVGCYGSGCIHPSVVESRLSQMHSSCAFPARGT